MLNGKQLRGLRFPRYSWQQDLENAFPYQETPDQIQAIEAVKRIWKEPAHGPTALR